MAAVLACQYDPYVASYAKSKPAVADMVGGWVPTETTIQHLAHDGMPGLRPCLVVHADGRIEMRDVPGDWRSSSRPGLPPEQRQGRWALERNQGGWWGIVLDDSQGRCSGCLGILRDKPPHLLVLRYGDPDEGWGYEFERADPQRDAADEARRKCR